MSHEYASDIMQRQEEELKKALEAVKQTHVDGSEDLLKYNPYHDAKGRFTTADGAHTVITQDRIGSHTTLLGMRHHLGQDYGKPKTKRLEGFEGLRLNERELELMAEAHENVMQHGKAHNTEKMVVITNNGSHFSRYELSTGEESAVRLDQTVVDLLKNPNTKSIVVHNHPRSSSFSSNDVAILAYPGVKGVYIAGKDGTNYYVGKKPSHDNNPLTVRQISQTYRAAYDRYYLEYYHKVNTFRSMTGNEAWKEHSHRTMLDVAKALNLLYRRVES